MATIQYEFSRKTSMLSRQGGVPEMDVAGQVCQLCIGAYKYLSELWRKKQSDVMRFLQRARCWEYRQQPSIVCPDKAPPSSHGSIFYLVLCFTESGADLSWFFCGPPCRVRRGGRKRPVPKGIVYGKRKPTNQGVTQLKFQPSKRSVAEERAGCKLGGLRVVNENSTYKYYEIILVDPAPNAIRNDPRTNWICNPVHKLRGHTSEGKKIRRGRGHNNHKNRPSHRSTWKTNNSISLSVFTDHQLYVLFLSSGISSVWIYISEF
ncbi:unnamed protein product [Arabis nemorensis]|uniref:Ribosomal protein L15 n=1 Tax=Arabis nemorensis TaxID=586526 RepID=A0A565CMY8_9BRAS|nr:unnamed protein product [Arabis nemorensis]